MVDTGRRNFLVRCCQSASAALVPTSLRGIAFPSSFDFDSSSAFASTGEFHLQPHYRAQRALDAVLAKTEAGRDQFVTEKYHDQIAAILAEWSGGLRQPSPNLRAVERALAPDFMGASPRFVDSRVVRAGSPVEVHRHNFTSHPNLGRDAFLQEFRTALSVFSEIVTVQFQVTSITAR